MTLNDLFLCGKIFLLAMTAWCAPPKYWRTVAQMTQRRAPRDHCWPLYSAILGQTRPKADIVSISKRRNGYTRELKLQILGLNGPWRSWRPDVRLTGVSNLEEALGRGRGAILWVLETSFSTLMVKMALDRAGYRAHQLSRPGHGFSASPFGIRWLNPLWTRVEDRFIAERVLITGETAAEALTALRARLRDNGVIIITVAPLAHKFVAVPFFNDQLELPAGPIQLALTSEAVLLPVFAFTKPNGTFEVSIDHPIGPATGNLTVTDVAVDYARRLEQFVLEHPDQWSGWDWLASRMN